jgi:hypothetical protein
MSRSNTALMTLNTAAFAPMPSASDSTTATVRPGVRAAARRAWRTRGILDQVRGGGE